MQGTVNLPFVCFHRWDFFFHLSFKKYLRSTPLKSRRITLILLSHSRCVSRTAWGFCGVVQPSWCVSLHTGLCTRWCRVCLTWFQLHWHDWDTHAFGTFISSYRWSWLQLSFPGTWSAGNMSKGRTSVSHSVFTWDYSRIVSEFQRASFFLLTEL